MIVTANAEVIEVTSQAPVEHVLSLYREIPMATAPLVDGLLCPSTKNRLVQLLIMSYYYRIVMEMDQATLTRRLDAWLLTDAKLALGSIGWRQLPDPFPQSRIQDLDEAEDENETA